MLVVAVRVVAEAQEAKEKMDTMDPMAELDFQVQLLEP
jgi:hypothetical protein